MSSIASRYFVPEDSKRVDNDDYYTVSPVWDPDIPGHNLGIDVSSAAVFSLDFEQEDHRFWMLRNLGEMGLSARVARLDNAVSWRGQKVASTFMSYDVDKSQIAFLSLGNTKPDQDLDTNCSEINLLLAVQESIKHASIGAIALAGPNDHQIKQPDGLLKSSIADNIMPSFTLQPCYRCDSALDYAPEIADSTILLSLAKDLNFCQIQTFEQYHKQHGRFALNGTFTDTPVFKFISDPKYWQTTAEFYAILRDKKDLKPSDVNDSAKNIMAKNKLLIKVLHAASIAYVEPQ